MRLLASAALALLFVSAAPAADVVIGPKKAQIRQVTVRPPAGASVLAAAACRGTRVSLPSRTGGRLWTRDWRGEFVADASSIAADGSISIKAPWFAAGPKRQPEAGPRGRLRVAVERLDGTGVGTVTAREIWQEAFAGSGMWSVLITFSSEGCWRVTGRVGGATHSFTLRVVRAP